MAAHFPHLLDPRIHPDDSRRSVRVPTWETFEHTTGFITLRDLAQSDWREDLDRYTEQFKLGRVIWPLINLLHCSHLAEVLDEIRRRGLYLFDLWSYVPGSPLEGAWSNITPPPGMVRHLQRTLGDRFLGIDNGEQDGRYIWATAEQQCPRAQSRFAQYLSFQRHFKKLGDELGNHMTALTSLTLGHYYLKEGNHLLLGAETAQALPNSQLYYAFIRGAGRQYGVHWFGNASVFNRWGWKDYGAEKRDGRYRSGPEEGTSLSLLKRLLYTHYLYNCVAIGFESGWLTEEPPYALTPIGDIQRGAVEFVARHGQPGVMHTPAALLLDFFSGWVPPRHLYTPYVYQVWGGMPYEAGDYLTHGVLSLLLPGYEDASYFRDERGFLSPTPFGDMTDCLLSDAPLWVLRQYGLLVAAGALTMTRELADKLRAFVAGGGHLVVTAGNARGLLPGLAVDGAEVRVEAGAAVEWSDGTVEAEEHAFALCRTALPAGAEVLARCGELACVVKLAHGKGHVTVLLAPFGLAVEGQHTGSIANAEEKPLACPFALLRHVRRALGLAFAAEQLFTVGDGLGFVTCRRAAGEYVLALYNNGPHALPWSIASRCGTIGSVRELELDRSEQGAVGQWPKGQGGGAAGAGSNGAHTIAGGDIRLFAVSVQERGVALLPEPQPPPRPRNRLLALRGAAAVQEEILRRPTFFEHFDAGVALPARPRPGPAAGRTGLAGAAAGARGGGLQPRPQSVSRPHPARRLSSPLHGQRRRDRRRAGQDAAVRRPRRRHRRAPEAGESLDRRTRPRRVRAADRRAVPPRRRSWRDPAPADRSLEAAAGQRRPVRPDRRSRAAQPALRAEHRAPVAGRRAAVRVDRARRRASRRRAAVCPARRPGRPDLRRPPAGPRQRHRPGVAVRGGRRTVHIRRHLPRLGRRVPGRTGGTPRARH